MKKVEIPNICALPPRGLWACVTPQWDGGILGCILGVVGRKCGFGRPRGPREGVWKGLGWPRSGLGPANGTNIDPTWPQVASSWGYVGPVRGSQAAPGPTQALPDPFPVSSSSPKPLLDPPQPPNWVLRNPTWSPFGSSKTSTWTLQDCKIGSTKCVI